eukprot:658625-Hanusia_phi.AAC.7
MQHEGMPRLVHERQAGLDGDGVREGDEEEVGAALVGAAQVVVVPLRLAPSLPPRLLHLVHHLVQIPRGGHAHRRLDLLVPGRQLRQLRARPGAELELRVLHQQTPQAPKQRVHQHVSQLRSLLLARAALMTSWLRCSSSRQSPVSLVSLLGLVDELAAVQETAEHLDQRAQVLLNFVHHRGERALALEEPDGAGDQVLLRAAHESSHQRQALSVVDAPQPAPRRVAPGLLAQRHVQDPAARDGGRVRVPEAGALQQHLELVGLRDPLVRRQNHLRLLLQRVGDRFAPAGVKVPVQQEPLQRVGVSDGGGAEVAEDGGEDPVLPSPRAREEVAKELSLLHRVDAHRPHRHRHPAQPPVLRTRPHDGGLAAASSAEEDDGREVRGERVEVHAVAVEVFAELELELSCRKLQVDVYRCAGCLRDVQPPARGKCRLLPDL